MRKELRKELRDKILSYNKAVKEKSEKATDMDILVAAIGKLPPGQMKKVLSDEVITVLRKYGIEI